MHIRGVSSDFILTKDIFSLIYSLLIEELNELKHRVNLKFNLKWRNVLKKMWLASSCYDTKLEWIWALFTFYQC